jgi:hypothetical protein
MNGKDKEQGLRSHLQTYLESLPLPGRELTSADVEKGQHGKQVILNSKANAVPILLDSLDNHEFFIKDACYDLILEIGSPAKEVLYNELGKRSPIIDIWITAILKHLGDESATDRVWALLNHSNEHVRHLSALALAFQQFEATKANEQLLIVLVDALNSNKNIEGTPFSVAGSALACLTRISGESFLSPPREFVFYNFEHFLYPPPLHPFPFASDFITKESNEKRQRIRQHVEAWLSRRTSQ